MMVAIFVTMATALLAAHRGADRLAVAALLACLVLSTAEFLYEIDSPVDGFRLPWLQADRPQAVAPGGHPA